MSSGFALRYLPVHYAVQSKSLLFASVDVESNTWRSEIHLSSIYKFSCPHLQKHTTFPLQIAVLYIFTRT